MSLAFSDTSTAKAGLLQEVESLIFGDYSYGRITGDVTLLATFTRNINEALNIVVSWILQSDNRWQYDDTNNTDYPIATTNLITTLGSEQQDYTLTVSHLKILRVEVKDFAGNWNLLKPIDQADVYDQSLTDLLKTAGMPLYYDKSANSVFLYPKPLATAVTTTSGLKVYSQRPPSYFVSTDTTKVPGFNSLYHKLVALVAARDYLSINDMATAGSVAQSVETMKQELQDFYALRNKDERPQLTAKKYNFR